MLEMQEKVCPVEVEENSSEKLEAALKERTGKIDECFAQADCWLQRGKRLQEELSKDLVKVQNQFDIKLELPEAPKVKKIKAKTKARNGTTVSQLIISYLGKHGRSKTKDIRKHLADKGRKQTNPGVALSRLVKDKKIKNVERGLYELV